MPVTVEWERWKQKDLESEASLDLHSKACLQNAQDPKQWQIVTLLRKAVVSRISQLLGMFYSCQPHHGSQFWVTEREQFFWEVKENWTMFPKMCFEKVTYRTQNKSMDRLVGARHLVKTLLLPSPPKLNETEGVLPTEEKSSTNSLTLYIRRERQLRWRVFT